METPHINSPLPEQTSVPAFPQECLMDAAQLYAAHSSKADCRQRQLPSLEKSFSVCLPWIPQRLHLRALWKTVKETGLLLGGGVVVV